MREGSWPQDCIQRAFVEGAKWWQFHHNGSTMFGGERRESEAEAIKRYGEPDKEIVTAKDHREAAEKAILENRKFYKEVIVPALVKWEKENNAKKK